LAKLCVCAFNEDEFGIVRTKVGDILEKFFDTMDALESYIVAPGIYWTDTESEGKVKAKLKEPKELLDSLELAVKDMVTAYRPYLNDLNLSVKVGKRARRVLEKLVDC